METFVTWATIITILAAAVTGLGVIWSKILGPLIARPVAAKVITEIGDALEGRWERMLYARLDPIEVRLGHIEDELTTNGGRSLKDAVVRLDRHLQDHIAWSQNERDAILRRLDDDPPPEQSEA